MEMTAHLAVPVSDRSHVAAARQDARVAAECVGFDETDAHRVGLVATEMASNLAKHTPGGQILVRGTGGDASEVELVALDKGPGIADVARSLADGHSTAGSSGTGLGAIQRLADVFEVYSQVGRGTAVLARVRPRGHKAPRADAFTVGGVSVAMPGESVCGDSWTATFDRGRLMLSLVDGLGHGVLAQLAATTATRTASSRAFATSLEALTTMHEAIRHTRGAAATVVSIAPRAAALTVAGVGNVSFAIIGRDSIRQAVSLGGILGHEVRQFREYQYPWQAGALFVMHSDGLISHWSLDAYPGLRQRDPSLAAAILYRDFQRGRDDVTVVVGREAA